ncbi:peptidylprolyl isomerase [Spongiimicrobium salis]|uniref:peptidylprolyl isomerase n=1 Tax=Spongiimicrobium salis TaxID=1667022 RepID=UPI00374CB8E0
MKRLKKMNLKYMDKMNKGIFFLSFLLCTALGTAQQTADGSSDQAYATKNDSLKKTRRVKLDGVAAVIGDYVILESDITKSLIDLKNQGASDDEVDRCSLLGKLMEDRMYAHQAVQDSILVSDGEINSNSDRQIQTFVQQLGSMEKLLTFFKKDTEESLRDELYTINKLRLLAERMQQKIVAEIEVTPEEVRQFFNNIPEKERPVFGAELEIAQIIKEPKASEEEKQKTIDKLNKIKADIEENGASFNVKAILYSEDDGSKSRGGFYPGITRKSGFIKEFKDVAFSLREGEISDPFETIYGYHIIYIEKIRGQELDLRHILLKPEISKKAMDAAKNELDSIRQKILDGQFTFGEAALNFSDDKQTKFDEGKLRNPINFGPRFELTRMQPSLYNQVRTIKDDEISKPILEEDPREGTKYKILKITNRYDEHVADFSNDYLKIQELALREKQLKTIRKWMVEHIKDTYISVNEGNRGCDFQNNWLKK